MIDQDLPHHLCGNCQEMNAILVIGLLLLDQAGLGFMNQRGGLEGVARPFIPQMPVGYFAQLGIDQRNEVIQSVLIAPRDRVEKLRNGPVFLHYQ